MKKKIKSACFDKYHFHMMFYYGFAETEIRAVYNEDHYWPRHLGVHVCGTRYHLIAQQTLGLDGIE